MSNSAAAAAATLPTRGTPQSGEPMVPITPELHKDFAQKAMHTMTDFAHAYSRPQFDALTTELALMQKTNSKWNKWVLVIHLIASLLFSTTLGVFLILDDLYDLRASSYLVWFWLVFTAGCINAFVFVLQLIAHRRLTRKGSNPNNRTQHGGYITTALAAMMQPFALCGVEALVSYQGRFDEVTLFQVIVSTMLATVVLTGVIATVINGFFAVAHKINTAILRAHMVSAHHSVRAHAAQHAYSHVNDLHEDGTPSGETGDTTMAARAVSQRLSGWVNGGFK